jgi:hypothetical protein
LFRQLAEKLEHTFNGFRFDKMCRRQAADDWQAGSLRSPDFGICVASAIAT